MKTKGNHICPHPVHILFTSFNLQHHMAWLKCVGELLQYCLPTGSSSCGGPACEEGTATVHEHEPLQAPSPTSYPQPASLIAGA
jgi:hypothetical protein